MADEVVARARAAIGAPFRLHGRDTNGIDCVGLAALAHGEEVIPTGYRLRTNAPQALGERLRRSGFARADAPVPGDVVVMRAGPAQLHLGVWTGTGLVHADARLRRVVETPGPVQWPILSIWRR